MSRGPRRIGQKRTGNAVLSLCMIVKNESAGLEKCLQLARPHVDEIVVVDTGSTDGTQEIARRYADVFEEIEWPDSFSAARNHSFDLARGDYILVLDGDEYIDDERGWMRIRKAINRRNMLCAQLPVMNLMREDQLVAADRMYQERVMRNHPRLRYTGRVHNQIQDTIREMAIETREEVIQVEAEVTHTGYALTPVDMAKKYAPRLRLLQFEYENPRSDVYRAYYGYQLGLGYYVLQRFDEAATVFNEIDYACLSPQNAFYTHLLAAQTALRLKNAPMALVHCNEMLSLNPNEPVAYHATGLALLMAKQISDGLLMLLEAYNVNDAARGPVRFLLNPSQVLATLARICGQVGLETHHRLFTALYEKGTFDTGVVKSLIASLMKDLVLHEREEAHA